MDPATTPLGKMLLEEITPVVMVLRTPLVEEACLKNGLSFIEMLSPFCTFSNIDGLAPFSHYIYISVRRIYVFVWSNWSFWDEFWVEIELLFFFPPVFNAVPVRTSSDQPYRLQKFKLRLFYESDIRQPNLEVNLCFISWKHMHYVNRMIVELWIFQFYGN